MKDEKDDGRIWYYFTLIIPSVYWHAKSKGGNAAEQADKALFELGRAGVNILIIGTIAGVIYLLLRLFGLI